MRLPLPSLGLSLLLVLGSRHVQAQADRNLERSLADARLLRNVEVLNGATAQVLRLRPVRYQVQSPASPNLLGPQRLGFVAQQLADVYPNLVHRDYDSQGTLRVEYTQLIPVLTRAVQEQSFLITACQSQIQAQGKALAALRAENGRLTVGLAVASVNGSPENADPNSRQVRELQAQVLDLRHAIQQLQVFAAQQAGTH